MNFKSNYITKDKVFEVMLDENNLKQIFLEPKESWVANNRTINKILVFNRNTKIFSEKSLYYDKNGCYFKGKDGGFKSSYKKYNIKDLKILEE